MNTESMLRAHNQALATKNLELLEVVRALSSCIDKLALTPADDFYKPGDHASGLVNSLWIRKNELTASILLVPGVKKQDATAPEAPPSICLSQSC